MKRSGFKKTKKSPLKKKSPHTLAKLQRDIWKLLRAKIRLERGNKCYTCDQTGLVGSNWHIGHLWAKASLGAYLKYDERVLRPQCYRCNIHFGGNGAEFYKRMLEEDVCGVNFFSRSLLFIFSLYSRLLFFFVSQWCLFLLNTVISLYVIEHL